MSDATADTHLLLNCLPLTAYFFCLSRPRHAGPKGEPYQPSIVDIAVTALFS